VLGCTSAPSVISVWWADNQLKGVLTYTKVLRLVHIYIKLRKIISATLYERYSVLLRRKKGCKFCIVYLLDSLNAIFDLCNQIICSDRQDAGNFHNM